MLLATIHHTAHHYPIWAFLAVAAFPFSVAGALVRAAVAAGGARA